jgi:hypothetical protein
MTDDARDVVAELAAALRADSADVDLSAGLVSVERDRSMKDRMAGRPGRVSSVEVRLGDTTLTLATEAGRPSAQVLTTVRDVVISRRTVSLAEWSDELAAGLALLAQDSAQAREAVARLLGA